jgi:hypothetical protein
MYEFALYGQVPQNEHARFVQQLTGVTRMTAQHVECLHLVFKSQNPPGASNVPSGDTSSKQDVQRIAKMLSANLYFVQVIGELHDETGGRANGSVVVNDADGSKSLTRLKWYFEFKDTPDPGKHPVSSRLVSRIPIEDGNIIAFMKAFGYEYVLSG